jgi:PAS domain S-box-containing protein
MFNFNSKFKLNIKSKMLIAFIALSLIPVIIVGFIGIVSNVNSLRQISFKNLDYAIAEMQTNLDIFFKSIEENVHFFTSSTTFNHFINAIGKNNRKDIDNSIHDLIPEVLNFTYNRDLFYQIMLIDSNGDKHFILQKSKEKYEITTGSEIINRGSRFYLYIAENIPPNTASFIPVELHDTTTNKFIPAISCIYHVKKGDFFGVLILQVYAESFFKIINKENLNIPPATIMLVNSDGYYLYHSDKKTEWNQLLASKDSLNLRKDFGEVIARNILSDSLSNIYEVKNRLIAQSKVFSSDFGLDNDYTLLISILKREIFKPVNNYLFIVTILFILFLFISLILALFATRQFINPLKELIYRSKIIASGNYETRAYINSNDEIEELADQFNIMAESLKQRDVELNQHEKHLQRKVRERTRDLENEKNKLNTIINNVPIGFILYDRKDRIISTSTAIENIFNIKTKDCLGKSYLDIVKWKGIASKNIYEIVKSDLKTKISFASIEKRDGTKKYLEFLLVPINNNSRLDSILEIITDITERKHLQDLLIHSERLAATGELAAVIAHGMRNSLTSVRMILQLLAKDHIGNEANRDSINVALDSVGRMEGVVNDLLQLSKPINLELIEYDINEVLKSGVEISKSHIQNKSINFIIRLDHRIPHILIDNNRIRDVIINLLLNAIQSIDNSGNISIYSKLIVMEKEIQELSKINIANTEGSRFNFNEIIIKKGSSAVLIKIEDSGSGISHKIINRIFDPFFTTKIKGTGLGLSLVKNVINQHGGIIEVNSKENIGSQFTIYIPIK